VGKLPGYTFYPGDWMKDPALRSVSYAARGLWQDMNCLMFENDRRGYLQVNGKPVTAEQLARMTGGSTDEVSRYLQELEDSGVFSRTEHGVIFSRRIVRDERERENTRERVKKHRTGCNGDVTPLVTPKYVDVNVPVVDVAFEVEAFDFEEAFNALFKIYPRRKDNHLTRKNFIDSVEKVSKRHQFRRSEAAAYILSRTEIYVSKCKFQCGLDKYLYDEIYEQDEAMWETVVQPGAGNGPSKIRTTKRAQSRKPRSWT
jgi:DNA-binding Lrp family transcriptional regulator